jgi:Cu-Zn family superoxide dismutase
MNITATRCSLALVALVTSCQKSADTAQPAVTTATPPAAAAPADKAALSRAIVAVSPIGSSGVSGQLNLSALPDDAGVKVEGELVGLSPGAHGMHVHEVGSCDSPDGMSAGGHFNPTSAPHGTIEAADSHVGDLGNITADAHGKAQVSLIKGAARLSGPATLVGRSIIVHKDADDFKSQPAGQSGPRIGCGVIRAD